MEKEFKTKLQHTNWEWFSKSIYQKHEVQFTPMHKWHIVSEATSDNCPKKLETGNQTPRFQQHPEPEVAWGLGGLLKLHQNCIEIVAKMLCRKSLAKIHSSRYFKRFRTISSRKNDSGRPENAVKMEYLTFFQGSN